MRNAVHKVLINLSAEAFLFLAVIGIAYLAVVMINGSLAVDNLLNQLLGLIDTA